MTLLHVICGLALPQSKILATPMHSGIKPCEICIPHTGRCILVLLVHLHERWLITLQRCKVTKYMLHCFQSKIFFGMQVWNGIGKKILVWNGIWNGRKLLASVWNMEKLSSIPFHTMPWWRLPKMTAFFFASSPAK